MKFLIRKTSTRFRDSDAPTDGCRKERFTRVHVFVYKSFAEYEKWQKQPFQFPGGSNYRVIRGPRGGAKAIAYDRVDACEGWFRDFTTLDELIAFTDAEGQCIIGWCAENSDIRQIEIYDDYRE